MNKKGSNQGDNKQCCSREPTVADFLKVPEMDIESMHGSDIIKLRLMDITRR